MVLFLFKNNHKKGLEKKG